jgi:hypothetical protein
MHHQLGTHAASTAIRSRVEKYDTRSEMPEDDDERSLSVSISPRAEYLD